MLFSASTFAYPNGSMGTPGLPMRCARNVRTKSCCSAINCHATYRVVATPASGVATAFLTYDSTVLFWVIPALSMGYSFGFLSFAKFTLRIGSRIALSFGPILSGAGMTLLNPAPSARSACQQRQMAFISLVMAKAKQAELYTSMRHLHRGASKEL